MKESILFKASINISIDITSPNLKILIKDFTKVIKSIFQQFIIFALSSFADKYLKDGTLVKILKSQRLIWKTSKGFKNTKIFTPFGRVILPQLQVKDTQTGKRFFITRTLLGIEPRKRIPEITKRYLALMGALSPLRVVNKFLSLFAGFKVSLMSIVRSIRDIGKTIIFGVDEKEANEFEADGTGIPIIKSRKRGKELKVLAQRRTNGGIRIAGMVIDEYKKGWKKLFDPLISSLKKFTSIFLVTDGDTTLLKAISNIKVVLQRCLFHIAYELKYTLWQDKVKRKSEIWRSILSKILDITSCKRIYEELPVLKKIILSRKQKLTRLINYCIKQKLITSASYLLNAKSDIFSGVERRISGGTTSLIERVMRTINQRINIAKWSTESALSVSKIRGAYYYNCFDV